MHVLLKWLVTHKDNFPWDGLLNAKLTSSDHRVFNVIKVINRPWPLGPLLTLKNTDKSESNTTQINFSAFELGRYINIELSAKDASAVEAFQNKIIEDLAQDLEEKILEAQEAKERRKKRDASRKFDLLLFDLDDTLVESGHLDNFRGTKYLGKQGDNYITALRKEALKLRALIPESSIQEVLENFPSLKIGIFTRAPTEYTRVILETCYPKINWDCVITYEDAQAKPSPNGIFKAASITCVSDRSRIALIGDDLVDIKAAYQAGIYGILFTRGWRGGWELKSSTNYAPKKYETLHLHPDAKISEPKEILDIVAEPKLFLPALESISEENPRKFLSNRIDSHNCFKPLSKEKIKIWVMGRYFPDNNSNYSSKRESHALTKQLLLSKDTNTYPMSWVEYCVSTIAEYFKKIQNSRNLLITCIPAKPDRPRRLEWLLTEISNLSLPNHRLSFSHDLFTFKENVRSNKPLDAKNRYANIRDNMILSGVDNLGGFDVIVLDDISTSGATFYYAHEQLKLAGANKVTCLALAQSI